MSDKRDTIDNTLDQTIQTVTQARVDEARTLVDAGRVDLDAATTLVDEAPVESAPASKESIAAAPRKRASRAPKAKAPPKKRASKALASLASLESLESKPRVSKPRVSKPRAKKDAASNDVAPPVTARADDQISIPPTWSHLGEHDQAADVQAADVGHAGHATPSPATLRVDAIRPPAPASGIGGIGSMGTVGVTDVLDTTDDVRVPPPAHRAKMQRYVKAVVGLAAVVCLAAFVRIGITRMGHAPETTAQAAIVAPPALPALPTVLTETTVEGTPETEETPARSANDEKKDALAALELRRLDDAIAAGDRSVALDPTDAQAWLILGAAHQDKGDLLGARRAYAECAKQAKRGDVRECTFLLH